MASGCAYSITYSEVAIWSSDFGPPKDPVVSFANQVLGADSPTHTTAMVNPHPQAQLVAPQVYVCTVALCCHIFR